MATPGQSSGTYLFAPDNASVVVEAFDRVQIRPTQLDRHHLVSARMSLNLELVAWSNRGVNLWEITGGSIDLVAGEPTYPMPVSLVNLTELWFTTVNGSGAGVDNDRFMVPMTRTQYAMIPNKLQPGTPTQYWFQRLELPQVTVYQVPFIGAPTCVLRWFGLQRVMDAGTGGGETPDIPYRAYDALCAGLTARLAEKFKPEMWEKKLAAAQRVWDEFAADDNESGPMIVQPNVGIYGRL
jgi:hypothetical protein